MSDATDGLRAVRDANQHIRAERRQKAAEQFEQARGLAESLGLKLQKFSDTHYRIGTDAFFWNIHPGNQRIQRSSLTCPLIHYPKEWDLLAIVGHADEAVKRNASRKG